MKKKNLAERCQETLNPVLKEGRLDYDTIVRMRGNLEGMLKEDLTKLEKRVDAFRKSVRNYTDVDEVARYCSDLQDTLMKVKTRVKGIKDLYR